MKIIDLNGVLTSLMEVVEFKRSKRDRNESLDGHRSENVFLYRASRGYLCPLHSWQQQIHCVSSVPIESCASSNIARILLTTKIAVAVTLWPTGHGSKKKKKKTFVCIVQMWFF